MLKRLELTLAARPQLLPEETFVFVQDVVGLYSGRFKIPNYQNGCAYLTTHRVCYVDNTEPRKYSAVVDLSDVDRYDYYAGFLRSSPKITFYPNQPATAPTTGTPAFVPGRSSSSVSPRSLTPVAASPAIRPQGSTWICPICSFSNPVPSNYAPQVTIASSIPPCLACGIRPQPSVVDKALVAQNLSLPIPQFPSLSNSPKAPSQIRHETYAPSKQSSLGFACPRCTFENHPSLTSCEMCGERLVSADIPDRALVDNIDRTDSPGPLMESLKIGEGGPIDYVKFSFRAGGAPAFYEKLKNVMIQRKWLLQNAPPVPNPRRRGEGNISPDIQEATSMGGRAKLVGIGALEWQGDSVRKNNDIVMRGALDDLESLMSRAKEMVALAESFATRLASQQSPSSSEAAKALQSSTMALGLSTISKDQVSTDLYLADLARQIAEFISDDRRAILKREGGVITLVDLWAMYNRARGIDLISPTDMERAAGLFEKLKLPVRLRRFKSGILVVHEAGHTDEATVKKIMSWMGAPNVRDATEAARTGDWGRAVTALEAAEKFGWSVGVASEELEMAEEKGWLCREVGVEGVRFWVNFMAPTAGEA
ncbi:vacuolar sorting-associated protein [Terfezia boudieri ATCC MYA-4762]|uniref:Vacuolar protein-sorting-associated protein 36 n=1 Tax=Terfezia boudieri ATCC MYA-4762 TaxID=1051890 RepID=A0A3N4LN48_9PEZI|nr:vacuolar sorting-associated protein [Terfezia boudieri ATCC MYA-4762]